MQLRYVSPHQAIAFRPKLPGFSVAKPFLTNQKFGLTAPMSPVHTARESLVRDWEYRADDVLPDQLKRMELPTHPSKNVLTFVAL